MVPLLQRKLPSWLLMIPKSYGTEIDHSVIFLICFIVFNYIAVLSIHIFFVSNSYFCSYVYFYFSFCFKLRVKKYHQLVLLIIHSKFS